MALVYLLLPMYYFLLLFYMNRTKQINHGISIPGVLEALIVLSLGYIFWRMIGLRQPMDGNGYVLEEKEAYTSGEHTILNAMWI